MKALLKPILAVITLLAVPAMVMGQKQTRKAVENAFKTGQYTVYNVRDSYKYSDYMNPHEEYFFTVKNCEIEWDDFNAYFKSNPQIVAADIMTETRLKYGAEVTFVKSFRFHNDHKKLSALEFGLQIENQNSKLKLPSFTNVKEAEGFYQKYVKNSSKHAKKYKERFYEVFTNYCKNNPDELKKFCDSSPYDNVEILRELDVRSLLANANRKYDYIYYCSANNGYFFDSKGDFHYHGDIRNGMPNGHGKNYGWEGSFVDGKKVGTFTQSTSTNHYDWSDTGIGGVGGNDWFFFKRTGTCVNDKWDGEVVLEVTHEKSGTLSDIEKEYYSNGELVKKELVSDCLSKDLRAKQENARAERERQKLAERASQVNVDNIMGYVKSIKVDESTDGFVRYEVTFYKNNAKDYIFYNGAWSNGYSGNGIQYHKSDRNARERALVDCWKFCNRLGMFD